MNEMYDQYMDYSVDDFYAEPMDMGFEPIDWGFNWSDGSDNFFNVDFDMSSDSDWEDFEWEMPEMPTYDMPELPRFNLW